MNAHRADGGAPKPHSPHRTSGWYTSMTALSSDLSAYQQLVAHDSHKPDFRGRLSQLPLPGKDTFRHLAGRCGDTIVIQILSSVGMRYTRKRGLATLGLRGIDSAALVDSRAPHVGGIIRSLGPAVRVIALKEMAYKVTETVYDQVGHSVKIRHLEYGTNNHPSDLLRVGQNEYWFSEFSSNSAVFSWSSRRHPVDVINSFIECAGSNFGFGRIIRLADDGTEELGEGKLREIVDFLHAEDSGPIEYVQAEIGDVYVSWKEPFLRFTDSNDPRPEVTVNSVCDEYSAPYDLVTRLTSRTGTGHIAAIGPVSFLRAARLTRKKKGRV